MIKKARKGYRKSQNELYKAYYGYAMSVALRFCSSREEAQEVTHDAFVKMFGNLEQFNQVLSFKSWFRKIIVNVAIDHYRKYGSIPAHLEILDHDQEVDENAISKLATEEILKAVGMLSPAYRMVFTLFVVEGLPHSEIAEKLGISVSTSKSNLVKARNRMKVILNDHLGIKRNIHGKL